MLCDVYNKSIHVGDLVRMMYNQVPCVSASSLNIRFLSNKPAAIVLNIDNHRIYDLQILVGSSVYYINAYDCEVIASFKEALGLT